MESQFFSVPGRIPIYRFEPCSVHQPFQPHRPPAPGRTRWCGMDNCGGILAVSTHDMAASNHSRQAPGRLHLPRGGGGRDSPAVSLALVDRLAGVRGSGGGGPRNRRDRTHLSPLAPAPIQRQAPAGRHGPRRQAPVQPRAEVRERFEDGSRSSLCWPCAEASPTLRPATGITSSFDRTTH